MHHINNNELAVFAVLLLLLSLMGQIIVMNKADEVNYKPTIKKVTGKASATGIVKLSIRYPLSSLNFTAILADDNESVFLSWKDYLVDNYSIYATENLSAGFNYSDPLAEGLTVFNYTDSNARNYQQRYYKLSIWENGTETTASETVGKFDIPIHFADGNPAGYELNQVSLPLIPNNLSFDNIVRWGTNGDIVLRFNTSDLGATFEGWETNLKAGGQWIHQFDFMSNLEGYVFIGVQNPYNLTVVGGVPEGDVTVPMQTVSGNPAAYEMMLLGWNSLKTNCNLEGALNTTIPPGTVIWFNTTDIGGTYEGWDTYILLFNGTDWDWFPSGGCMRPDRGYRFLSIGAPYNWTYDRTI